MATKNGTKAGAKNGTKASATKGKSTSTSKVLIWTLVVAALVIGGFLLLKPANGSAGGVTNVDQNGVLKAQSDGVRVIDVRSSGEYEAGHVPGAENVPIDQFAQAIQSWDKNAPVLVYCATGSRSAEAVELLKQAGFKSIYHFNQGLQAWTGTLDTAKTASAPAVAAKPTALPVMYEFYTDW